MILEAIISLVISLIIFFIAYKIGVRIGQNQKESEWQGNMIRIKRGVAERQRAGIKGRMTETFAPFLEGFTGRASESKFLGDPIDYIVFDGLEERKITGIKFVEIKTGTSGMNDVQKQIKNLINNYPEKIKFEEIRLNVLDKK